MTKEEFIKRAKRVREVMRAVTNGAGYLEMELDRDPTLKEDIDFWRKKYTEGGRFSEGSEAADLALMEKYLLDHNRLIPLKVAEETEVADAIAAAIYKFTVENKMPDVAAMSITIRIMDTLQTYIDTGDADKAIAKLGDYQNK